MLAERDEMLTTAPPPTVSDHVPRRQLGQRQWRRDVEREGPGHEALARLHGRPRHGPAGVVDQNVEPAEFLDRARHQLLARRGVGDVGRHDQRAAPEGADQGGHLPEV